MTNNDFSILLKAEIDKMNSKQNIESVISSIQNKISPIKIKIDTNSITQSIQKAIQDGCKNTPSLSPSRSSGNGTNSTISDINKKSERIGYKDSTGVYEAQIAKVQAQYERFGFTVDEVKTKLSSLRSAYDILHKAPEGEKRIAAEKRYQKELDTTKNKIVTLSTTTASPVEKITLSNKIETWLKKNTAASQEARVQLEAYLKQLESTELTKHGLKNIEQGWKKIEVAERSAGRLGKSFKDSLASGISKFKDWIGASYIVMTAIRGIRNMIKAVCDLDTALVDLKKTTTMTSSQLKDFYYSSNDTAKEMGVSTTEIINQASAWSRLGYSSAEAATKMAKYSSQFSSISPGMDTDTATDGLVSMMKAFDIGNDNPDEVLDGIMSKVNIIGNTAATSNAEIVEMMKKSSSAMKEANNSLEETIALETAAVEITRNAEMVGTAYKTVSMRLRGYDEETESYSNDIEQLSGDIADLTKTSKSPGGISLFTDESKTEYKSTYQLLKDISEIYSELDDKTQAQLLEKIAGKRQGQVVAATINNFSAAEKAMESMANSTGSANKEMAIITDSIGYKMNALKETGTGIAQNLFGRNEMKSVIDVLTKLAEAIDYVTDKFGLLSTIGMGTGLYKGIKNVGRVKLIAYPQF